MQVLANVLIFAISAFPKPTSFVNDFAHVLSKETVQQLENQLQDYAQKTGVEIALVTVTSLNGNAVEDYTNKLAQSWGVGDKQKNNGVVFLVAPQERKTRIEVGYGLEPDLTDIQCGQIIREKILPSFKEKDLPQGIINGVNAIINELGSTPFNQREEERLRKAEKIKRQRELEGRQVMIILLVLLALIVCAVLIGVIYQVIIYYRNEKEQKQRLFKENKQLLEQCIKECTSIKDESPKATCNWKWLKNERAFPEFVAQCEMPSSTYFLNLLVFLQNRVLRSDDLASIEKDHKSLTNELQKIRNQASVFDQLEVRVKELERAKRESPSLLKSLPESLKKADQATDHPDVSNETKKLIVDATQQLNHAQRLNQEKDVDWLTLFGVLVGASSLIATIEQKSEEDKQYAIKARAEGPALLVGLEEKLADAIRSTEHSDVSSSTKRKLADARAQYAEIKEPKQIINWITLFGTLTTLIILLNKIQNEAKQDIRSAEDERERAHRRRSDSNDSYSSSNYSFSSSGFSSSSGGSSFGGFGGGSFGGGGASGSW